MENLENEKEKFGKELVDLTNTFEKVKKFDSYKHVKEFSTEVMQLNDRFDKG